MNKWMGVFLKLLREPRLWLGLGIGLGSGVVIAAGIGFDKSDAARFLGALVGALVAVTGAISLHYLKEHEEREERRHNLRLLITTSIGFARVALQDLSEDDDPETSIETLTDQLSRTRRYAEKYEFDDIQISLSLLFLINIKVELFDIPNEAYNTEKGKIYLRDTIKVFVSTLSKACDALDSDTPRVTKDSALAFRSRLPENELSDEAPK